MKSLTRKACTHAFCTMVLLFATPSARAYTERTVGEYRYNIATVAEAFGYSAVPVPEDVMVCRPNPDGSIRCLRVPPGSILLVPAEPDSTGVR